MVSYGLFSFGYHRSDYFTRYWSDESQRLNTFGTLYPGAANKEIASDHYVFGDGIDTELITYAFDSYNLFDYNGTSTSESVVDDQNDPQKQLGGSLPAFDQYNVLGQGIAGVMQPIILENGDLYGQSLYEKTIRGEPAIDYPNLEYKSLRKF